MNNSFFTGEMKKYFIVGFLGLILSGVLGYFMFNKGGLVQLGKQESLTDFIPGDFSQVFYVKANDDVMGILGSAKKDDLPKDVLCQLDLLKDVNEVGIVQFDMNDAFFLKLKPTFNFDEAIECGFIPSGDGYDSKKVGTNIYIYGSQDALNAYTNYKGDMLTNMGDVKEFISDKYDISLFSKGDPSGFETQNQLLAQYAGALKYGAMLIDIQKDDSGEDDYNIDGKIQVVFENGFGIGTDYSFESTLGGMLGSKNLFFAEMGNIIEFIGLTSAQVKRALPEIIGPEYQYLISSDTDIQKLVDGLNSNIGVVIGDSDNILGIGGGVLFDNEEIYKLAEKYFAIVKGQVEDTPEFQGVEPIDLENKKGFKVDMPMPYQPETNISTSIFIEKKDGKSILNIGDIDLSNPGESVDYFNDKTMVRFFVNFEKIINLYKKASLFNVVPGGDDFVEGLWFLEDKNLSGYISIEGNKLNLKFKVAK